MTRIFLSATLLAWMIAVSGCQTEKTEIETYLQEHRASSETMTAIGHELKTAMLEVKAAQESGSYDPETTKATTKQVEEKMRTEKTRFEAITVPEKCQVMHQATLSQYEAAIGVLAKTPAIVDTSLKMAEGFRALKEAPKEKKQALLTGLKPIEAELHELQKEISALAATGTEAQRTVDAETAKLREQFKLSWEPANSGGATPTAEDDSVQATPAGEATTAVVPQASPKELGRRRAP